MNIVVNIRDITQHEIPNLESFLYEAIFVPEGVEKPGKDILNLPELKVYINDFGKTADLCLVADYKGTLVGAIWSRLFSEHNKGFGFIDEQTPELSMSVKESYRQQGIGKQLLTTMIEKLKRLEYKQVSLSVARANFALDMYLKFGFEIVSSDKKSAIMVKRL